MPRSVDSRSYIVMISRRTSAALVSLVCGLLVVGCASKPDSSPESFELDEPASADTSSRNDTSASGDAAAPRRFEAGHFDWAPEDTPVVLHTVEESRATKEQWSDLRRPTSGPEDDEPDVGFEVSTSIDPTDDEVLSPLRPHLEQFMKGPMLEPFRKGASLFVGFGGVFEIDGSLHLFECRPGSHDALAWPDHEKDRFKTGHPHWTVGDVVVECEWSNRRWPSLRYFVRRDDDGKGYDEDSARIESSTRTCRDDVSMSIPPLPPVPERFARWWKQTVDATIQFKRKQCNIVDTYSKARLPVFVWAPSRRMGFRSIHEAIQGRTGPQLTLTGRVWTRPIHRSDD